ncbi:universal stress protein [Halioxenophilus sp. WMMB6]|uniref:universal stress protein n=1 Tax=Halioxenophilus sp. WMMB6 TaxID=3073815 RepID=UPI00295EED72|nr:universal stress protein [Halioxenophilus sp. WMMB6]
MSTYKHIIAGLDLSNDSKQIVEKAKFLADATKAKLSIAHVIEPLVFTYGGDIPMDISSVQEQIETQATKDLAKLGEEFGIASDNQFIVVGQPANELHAIATQNGGDLIVVGSHGRHGLSLLLGSTSNSVLHGSQCDVLAVRVK